MLTFTAVVLVLLSCARTFFLDDIYKTVKLTGITHAVEEITSQIYIEDVEEVVNESAAKYDTCISVWDVGNMGWLQTASVCVDRGCRLHTYSLVGAAHYYKKAKENGGEYIRGYESNAPTDNREDITGEPPMGDHEMFDSRRDNYESVMYAKITADKNGNERLVLMNSVLTVPASVKYSLGAIFIIIGIVMVLFSIVISVALSGYVLEPIYKINDGAKLLAKGDYNVVFDEGSYSEVAQLAQSLNYAALELSGVERMRRELMANVSHDLRTPLTLISGYAEMMKDFPNDDNKDNLQVIIDEASHMILLVNDMADVSKYNAGVQKLQRSEFDFTAKIQETAQRIQALNYNEYNIEFEPAEHMSIEGDELKLTQVLYNLINNAITHTGADKRVVITQTVTERLRQKYVEIRVTDSGDGISKEDAKTVWNRYYKMDKTYKRAHNGSGLGLSIVKSILDLHRAEYGVVSRDQMPGGTGCTFWFKIPAKHN